MAKNKSRWCQSAIVFIGAVIAFPITTIADFDTGMRAYQSLDFVTARKEWMTDGLGGHRVAQYYLGDIFSGGYSVEVDQSFALSWYKLSAKQGYTPAQIRLGWIYSHGEGVDKNDIKAFNWYQLAAELGDTEAQYQVGFMYHDGHGTEKNLIQATKWWSIAALWGDPDAGTERDKQMTDMSTQQISKVRNLVQQWEAKFALRDKTE